LDVAVDGGLTSAYKHEINLDLVTHNHSQVEDLCRRNLTLLCFAEVPTGEAKFWTSFAIIMLPFLFYLFEVARFFRLFEYSYPTDTPSFSKSSRRDTKSTVQNNTGTQSR
jgi:hypothetical protein